MYSSHPLSHILGGKTYTAFLPVATPNYSADAPGITRKIGSEGPVTDISTANITCNIGAVPILNSDGTSRVGEVAAGTDITFAWNGFTHSGPVMTYMAKCSPDCGHFTGSQGAVWFKVDEIGYNATAGAWGTQYLADQKYRWITRIPQCLESGEYLVRQEIMGMGACSVKGKCQFYPHCVQVKVIQGLGTKSPSADQLISLPGGYKADDKGILWDTNTQDPKNYKTPGPAVFTC